MRVPRRWLLSVVALGIAILGGLAFARQPVAAAKPSPGMDAAGDPQLVDLEGYRALIARYHGKGLLVNFWATWCQPCRDEYPMIISLSREYGPQGLAVVGVTLDEDADLGSVREFLDKTRPGFPNFRQRPGINADAFYQGVNPDWRGTMPQTDFYGRDGHLARYFVGEKAKDAYVQAIRLILLEQNSENRQSGTSSTGN